MHVMFNTFMCVFSGAVSKPTAHVRSHYGANYPSFVITENFVTYYQLWENDVSQISLKR